MGIRIHRAIGYGMVWEQFLQLCLLKGSEPLTDQLETAFEIEELIMPSSARLPFNFNNLLVLEHRLLSKKPIGCGSATDLFSLVGYDHYSHIIFYPSIIMANKWHRYDDDIDYAFSTMEDKDHNNRIKFYPHGFSPYQYQMMTPDGQKLNQEEQEKRECVPEPPLEIRWYLNHLNVLDDNGINQLRPLIAEW